jgi:hypothetical protein
MNSGRGRRKGWLEQVACKLDLEDRISTGGRGIEQEEK